MMTDGAHKAVLVLRGYRQLDHRSREIVERIARLQASATRATSSFAATRTSGGDDKSRVESAVVMIVDLKDQLCDMLYELTDTRYRIQSAIQNMDSEEQKRILELRYIDGRSWEYINQQMYLTRTTSYRMHIAALESFWAAYKDGTK